MRGVAGTQTCFLHGAITKTTLLYRAQNRLDIIYILLLLFYEGKAPERGTLEPHVARIRVRERPRRPTVSINLIYCPSTGTPSTNTRSYRRVVRPVERFVYLFFDRTDAAEGFAVDRRPATALRFSESRIFLADCCLCGIAFRRLCVSNLSCPR